MITEIFMEGRQLDITEDIQALFTYSVADVANFSKRNTTFSKTITLPGSARNNAALGHAFEFTASNDTDPTQANVGKNFNAARVALGLVLQGGVQVFQGVLRLLEIKQSRGFISYEVQLLGELGGLSSAIGSKLLTGNAVAIDNLDFELYNQTWVYTNMTASWVARSSTGGGSGVFFPLIDYGGVSTDKKDYLYTAFRPALYVREYMDKIIRGAGYTYECPFFNTTFFKRLIIPNNDDMMYRLTSVFINASSASDYNGLLNSVSGGINKPVIFGTTKTLLNFTNVFSGQPNGSTFTYTGPTSFCKISTSLKLRLTAGENLVRAVFTIKKNGSIQLGKEVEVRLTRNDRTPVTTEISLAVTDVSFASGDTLSITATALNGSSMPTIPWEVDILAGSTLIVEPNNAAATPAVYGDTLSMSQSIPKNVKQKDLLLSIVQMFGLYILEDPAKLKHLKILPYRSGMADVTDFFNNADPLNWTDKLDRSQEISQKPLSEMTAKRYLFKYDTDGDYLNELYRSRYNAGYGDLEYYGRNEFASTDEEVKLIFAPSPLIGNPVNSYVGRDKYVTPLYKLTTSGGSAVEEPMATKIRILQTARIFVANWNLTFPASTTFVTLNAYGYAGHVDNPQIPSTDLNFGATREIYWNPIGGKETYHPAFVYNAFHSPYLNEIDNKDSKMLTAFFRLSPVDIANLDFARSIYIDGQLWRLNKIVDYDAVNEGLTKVELLKVINLNY